MKALLALACAALSACAARPTMILPPPVPASAPTGSLPRQAQAPVFAVGEMWEYRFESELDIAQNATYAQKVAKTGGGATEMEISGGRAGPASLDQNANYKQFGAAMYEPSDQRLSFPLFVGKTWTASYVYRNGSWRSQCDRRAKVVAVEQIQTSAGLFDAFRIEEKTLWQTDELYGGQGVVRETLWYAPAAKRIVRSDLWDMPLKGPPVSTRLELLRHVEPPAGQ